MFVIFNRMSKEEKGPEITLGGYVRAMTNQEIKGIVLKIKNETNKEDLLWEELKPVLRALLRKDEKTLIEILPFILAD